MLILKIRTDSLSPRVSVWILFCSCKPSGGRTAAFFSLWSPKIWVAGLSRKDWTAILLKGCPLLIPLPTSFLISLRGLNECLITETIRTHSEMSKVYVETRLSVKSCIQPTSASEPQKECMFTLCALQRVILIIKI